MARLPSVLTSGLAAETGFISPRQIPAMISGAVTESFQQIKENIRPDAMVKNLIRETGLSDIIPTFSFGLDRLFDQSSAEAAEDKKRAAEEKKRAAEEKKAAAAAANSSNSVLQEIKNVLGDTYDIIASRDVETAAQIAERRRLAGEATPAGPAAPGPVPVAGSTLGGIFDFFGKIAKVIGGAGGLAAAGLGLSKLGSLFGFLGRLALKAGPLALIGASLVALDAKDWEKFFSDIRQNVDLIVDGKWLEGTSGAIASLADLITRSLTAIAPISEESKKEITDKLNEIDLPGKARSIAKSFSESLDEVFGEQVGGIAQGVASVAAVGLTIGLSKKIFSTLSSGAFWMRLGIPGLLVGGVLIYGDQIRESLEKFFSEQPMPDWADPGLTAGLTTGALGAAGAAMGVRSLAQLVGAGRFAGKGALAAGLATFTIMAGNSLKDWLDDQGKLNPITDTLINATSFTATGASLGMMFGLPHGMLIGAAVGLAIGLGYSLVNWLNGIKDKQEKIFLEESDETLKMISKVLEEGGDFTEEQINQIKKTREEAIRRQQLNIRPEQIQVAKEVESDLEKVLAAEPLSPDRATPEQLFQRLRRIEEGDQTALMELRNIFGPDAENQIKSLITNFAIATGGTNFKETIENLNQSIKSIDQLMQEKTEEVIQKNIDANERLSGAPDQTVSSLGEGEVVDSPQAAAVWRRFEAMEKMKREEEAIARRREQAASTQAPIVVNNNSVQQGGNGVAAPVGSLHTRPANSALNNLLFYGAPGGGI